MITPLVPVSPICPDKLDIDLIEQQRRQAHVGQVRVDVHVADTQAIDQRHTVTRPASMRRHLGARLIAEHATDVRISRANGRHERRHLDPRSAGRQFLERRVRHRARLRGRLNVDDWALTRDGDRFLDRAHPQIGVDVRREVGRHFDGVALDRAESWQPERDAVVAGRKIDDAVLTGPSSPPSELSQSAPSWRLRRSRPGSTAPDASFTAPAIVPSACALLIEGTARNPSVRSRAIARSRMLVLRLQGTFVFFAIRISFP